MPMTIGESSRIAGPLASGAAALGHRMAPRLCIVGPLPPPEGGMANQTRQLAKFLDSEGVPVEIVRSNAPISPRWIGGLRGVRAIARLIPYVASLWSAYGRCDVVHLMANSGWAWHLFAAPALWIAWIRGKPVVVNYRGGEAETFLARSPRIVRMSLRRARIVAVPSRFLQKVFSGHAVSAEVVPNIVDLTLFAPRAFPRDGPEAPHIVVTRNLEAIYDNETAIRAFAIVRRSFPSSRLSIAGTGPELERLRQVAVDCGVAGSIAFLGRLEREAVATLYQSADVALNPSRVDNMPNSILEALASGVPVVSTDVGGVPDMVEHGRTALLTPPQDPQAMAGSIARLLNDRGLAQRIASAGLADVQRFGWPAVRQRWIDIYARLVAGRQRGKVES